MKKYLLSNKNCYKANLHCHSTISDGKFTPEQLKALYKQEGYSILAYTDHEILVPHTELTDENFLALTGYEVQIYGDMHLPKRLRRVCHINFIAKEATHNKMPFFNMADVMRLDKTPDISKAVYDGDGDDYKEYSANGINDLIKKAKDNGFIVSYNHPTWSKEDSSIYTNLEGLFAMEIYNTGAEKLGNSEYNSALYDLLLKKGKRLCCVAADDNHNFSDETSPYCDSFGGFVMINANALTHKAVFSALENREFYSSTGPIINELYVENGYVFIKCSEAKKIRMHTHNRYSAVAIAEDKPLTEACFKLAATTEYFRIEVTDHSGEKAYTNAYFLDELK